MSKNKKPPQYDKLELSNGRMLSWIDVVTGKGDRVWFAEMFGIKGTRVSATTRMDALNKSLNKALGLNHEYY